MYRFVALAFRTNELLVIPPYRLSAALKATFYIFHALPELLIAWYIQTVNIRRVFNTSPWGDYQDVKKERKEGPPRLRQNGLIVDGVGVEPLKKEGKEKRCRRSCNMWWGSLWSRHREEEESKEMELIRDV